MSVKPTLGRKPTIRRWSVANLANTRSAHFDGVDDKITATRTGLGVAGSSYTTALFFRIDSLTPATQLLLSEKNDDNTGPTTFEMTIATSGANRILQCAVEGTAINGGTVLSADTWYHGIFIRNNAGPDTLELYLNRVSDATAVSYTDNDKSATGDFLNMGVRRAAESPFDGLEKDVRIFNVALNATNIALLTVANIGKKPSEISGWDTANAADANQLRHYNFEPPWSNATVNAANQVKDTGNDLSHGTGANFAGSATSGVDSVVPT